LDVKTLAQYTDWMKGMTTVLPDASYEVKSFATECCAEQRRRVRRFSCHSYGPRRPGSRDRPPHQHRLRLCDAVRRRQDRPHDQDLARRSRDEGSRMDLTNSQTPLRMKRRAA
jgi:hypothetical protein